jgi:pimeloyl-ACP methyl ester carboxylesterase
VTLRNQVSAASLVILEAPAAELLRESGEDHHYRSFHQMTDAYFADYRGGNLNAISARIGFYGGAGTFASWPPRVCAYAVQTTPVNILDWTSAYQFRSPSASLASVNVPALVIRGGTSHSAMQRANELLSEDMGAAALITIAGAAHFMIATHSEAVAQLVGQHAHRA